MVSEDTATGAAPRRLSGSHFRHQGLPSLSELFTLNSQGDLLATATPWAEVLTERVKGGTESRGSREAAKAEHGVITLLDPAMVLLGPVVEVLDAAMLRLPADDPANCFAVGGVAVRSHALGSWVRALEATAH